MKIDARHALQAEQDRVGGETLASGQFRRLALPRVRQRIEIVNVQLVRGLRAVWHLFAGDEAAMFQRAPHQSVNLHVAQDTARRVQADPVVRGQEIEEGHPVRRRRQRLRPVGEFRGVAGGETMQHQRRQGEVIDQLRFVRAVPEVGDVVGVRHVGFRDEPDVRGDLVQHGAHELDDRVRLRPVQAGRPDFLPEKGDGIQPDEPRPFGRIEQQRLQHGRQHAGILEVEVHLVGAERGPHLARPARGRELREQRQRARTHHLRQVRMPLDRHEEIPELRLIALEPLKPVSLRRQVIEHGVEHQIERPPEARHVLPRAQGRVHREVVSHREAVIGRRRTEGQDMHAAERLSQMRLAEVRQCLQRRLAWLAHLVSVSDQQRVALRERMSGAVWHAGYQPPPPVRQQSG